MDPRLLFIYKLKESEELWKMKVWPWIYNGSPCEPMGMGSPIGTFVEVGPPNHSRDWPHNITIMGEDFDGYAVLKNPVDRLGNFWIDDTR